MFDFLKKKPDELFTADIYEWMREKQLKKYGDIFPKISQHLQKDFSVLDIGIGKAWFEEFLEQKGFGFKRIVGTDVDEKMILPKKSGIEYHLDPDCMMEEKFDFVVCFDSVHLLPDPLKLFIYVKPDGLLLVSVPERWKEMLEAFRQHPILAEGEIGEEETDYFVLVKGSFFNSAENK